MMHKFTSYIIAMLCISSVSAQKTEKMQGIILDSVLVKSARRTLHTTRTSSGSLLWDMKMMDDMPKILGNADPMHYAQMLPGIQTNNEYNGGIHVQGSDNEHNETAINGVPIYNASHLLGFFSTFNASHYKSLSLNESAQTADFSNRLGAQLNMLSDNQLPDSMNVDASIGLISSQGTMRIPVGKHSALTVSARASYINTLYGSWLEADDTGIDYTFYDLNATYMYRMNNKHTFLFDAYMSEDDAKMRDKDYQATMHDKWGNAMAAAHWKYDDGKDNSLHTTLYVTSYRNRLSADMMDERYMVSSRITDYGIRCNAAFGNMTCGADAILHDIRPMRIGNNQRYNTTQANNGRSSSAEASAYANYQLWLSDHSLIEAGLRGNIYFHGGRTYQSANPSVRLTHYTSNTKYTLAYATRHQYLFQTGFSDAGMPTEFWLPACKAHMPQHAHGITVQTETYLLGRRYQLSFSAYYKRLYNQIEYGGTALDIVNSNYDLNDNLLHGDGHNYGATAMLSKCTGRLTGWICYSFGKARRTFVIDDKKDSYPANHDRTHEVNLVATYATSRHWSFGTTMVACSGTPFTAPQCAYILNGNIVAQMGEHNANRLKAYMRIDLSANYKWHTRHNNEQGVNLSLYNVLCRNNDLFHFVRTNKHNEMYYKSVHFVSPILPSVSYFIKL